MELIVETIKMKEKLISLAKEKGFMAILLRPIPYKEGTRWYSLESIRYYIWMCELQKWLREKHEIYLAVLSNNENAHRYVFGEGINSKRYATWYKTYEEALEEGLKQGLMLIK